MKKILIVLLLVLSLCGCSEKAIIEPVNLDGVSIFSFSQGNGIPAHIVFKDGTEKEISEDYVPLFVNGSLLKHGGILIENNVPLVPFEAVRDAISTSNNVELYEHDKNAKINGENYLLEIEPKMIGDSLYIGLNDISHILGVNATYFDDIDKTGEHIVKNVFHIMISKYPEGAHKLSEAEAMEILKKEFLIAYEKKFGEFTPLNEKPPRQDDDENMLRYLVTNMKVESENDRFYKIPIMYEFWVDKYTKQVYVYYNGIPMTINLFDPEAKNAIDFPG